MKRALLLAVAAAFLLVACRDDSSSDTTTTAAKWNVRVYFLRDGKVWPVARVVERDAIATSSLDELLAGPDADERRELGLTTAISEGDPSAATSRLALSGGVVTYSPAQRQSTDGLAQIVYTLTELPGVTTAEIGRKRYTRADFEDETPIILVESPLPFENVTTPLRVTGTANTFEATFQYELLDSAGKVVDKNFVTATSGTGTRGTFDFTTKKVDDVAALRVFELSAEDGSRIHEAEIPLTTST